MAALSPKSDKNINKKRDTPAQINKNHVKNQKSIIKDEENEPCIQFQQSNRNKTLKNQN